jgi:hypothetical protein
MKVTVTTTIDVHFSFQKYCDFMFAVVPKEDTIGIGEIRFVDSYSHPKTDRESLGCYLRGRNGTNAAIEIDIPNILKEKVNEFSFTKYPEVAALMLSQVLFNEIGHHVHTFKRHGVKKDKKEDFSESYAAACYYRYLSSRRTEILAEYKRGSWNILEMDKGGRASARKSRSDILAWLEKNEGGVPFP